MNKKLLIVFLLCSLSNCCYAWFPLAKGLQRLQIGYTFINTSANYNGQYRTFTNIVDTSYTDNYLNITVHSKQSYGFIVGSNFLLKKFNSSLAIAIDVNVISNTILWENIGNNVYKINKKNISGVTAKLGVPIDLSLKYGCDANNLKNQFVCASFGVGIQPCYNFTGFIDNGDIKPSFTPFLMAEAGLRVFLCFKLRLTYSFDNSVYLAPNSSLTAKIAERSPLPPTQFTLTGKPCFNMSVIVMPFSWNWRTEGWWQRTNTSKMMY